MGCASSGPLVEGGKKIVEEAKDSVTETVSKGGKAMQDVGETAKEGIQSGMETVKETVQHAVSTAENSVESVLGKIGETFHLTSSAADKTMEELDTKKDELLNNASDTAAEVVSEAETVLASEAESAKEAFSNKSAPVFETLHSFEDDVMDKVEEVKQNVNDVKENAVNVLDDVEENFDMLGDSVEIVGNKVEEVISISPLESPAKETKKKEVPPTFWEAAADAILLRKTIKSMDFREPEEKNIFRPPETYEVDMEPLHNSEILITQFLNKDKS